MTKKTEKDTCAVCGASAVERRTMTQQFAYADGSRDVLLIADIPVEHCQVCGEILFGAEGEKAQHEAVCRYLGRLSPTEIKSIRKGLGLSQRAFADRFEIGLASLKRWETGAVIQNQSMDSILRRAADGADRPPANNRPFTPVFRTEIKAYMIAESKLFRLRPCAA